MSSNARAEAEKFLLKTTNIAEYLWPLLFRPDIPSDRKSFNMAKCSRELKFMKEMQGEYWGCDRKHMRVIQHTLAQGKINKDIIKLFSNGNDEKKNNKRICKCIFDIASLKKPLSNNLDQNKKSAIQKTNPIYQKVDVRQS